MSGFDLDVEDTIVVLEFEDKPGLVVKVKEADVDTYLSMIDMASAVRGIDTNDTTNLNQVKTTITSMYEAFAGLVVDWTVNRSGNPVPVTTETIRGLGMSLSMRMITAWIDAVGGVEAPLGPDSPSTETLLVGSLPQEPLPSSPVN